MQEITVVTAFFDIGKDRYKQGHSCTVDKYMHYFDFWSSIRNNLIVYTEGRYKERIEQIRAAKGLSDRTKVISLDLLAIDPELWAAISGALSRPEAVAYRDAPDCPESFDPYYDYVMQMKYTLIARAVGDGLAEGMVAWLDFGYNHGGEQFPNPSEFDFLWETDLPERVNLFFMDDDDGLPIFEVVRNMHVYVSGGLVLAPDHLWQEMARLVREAALALALCGFADDDQTTLLMASRMKPGIFNKIPIESWFSPLLIASGRQLTVRQEIRANKAPHKLAKRAAVRARREGRYRDMLSAYCKYAVLKISGK